MKLLNSIKRHWLVWMWQHTPNCAEMSRLASRALDQPLLIKVRCQIRLHYLICGWCRRYETQLRFLHQTAPRLQEEVETVTHRGLSAAGKRRMVGRLREECRH